MPAPLQRLLVIALLYVSVSVFVGSLLRVYDLASFWTGFPLTLFAWVLLAHLLQDD